MSLSRVLASRRVLGRILQIYLVVPSLIFQGNTINRDGYGNILGPMSQKQYYSAFSEQGQAFDRNRDRTGKILVLEKVDTASVLDGLTNDQQDTILELNKYLRRDYTVDFGRMKELILRFARESQDTQADVKVIEYFLKLLDLLKHGSQDVLETSQVVRDEPLRLNEIFDDQEIYKLLTWLCGQIWADEKTLQLYETSLAKLIIPELFVSAKDSKKLTLKEIADVYVFFNQFLLHQQFYKQAVENLGNCIKIYPMETDKLLDKTIRSLERLQVRDPITIYRIFQLLAKGDEDERLLMKWIQYFIESYMQKVSEEYTNLKYMKDLEEERVLNSFTEVVIGLNSFTLNVKAIETFNQHPRMFKQQTGKLLSLVAEQVFEQPKLSAETFNAILHSSIYHQDDFLVSQRLVELFKEQNQEIPKKSYDLILAWEAYKSFGGNDFTVNNEQLLAKIQQISQFEMTPEEQEVREVNGEIYLDLYDDQSKSYINVDTVAQLLQAAGKSGKSSKYIESMLNYFNQEYNIEIESQLFAIIIDNAISNQDVVGAKKFFQMSLDFGINWSNALNETNDLVLYRLIQLMFTKSESYQDLQDAFGFFRKMKNFLEEIDSDTVSVILEKFLNNNYVGDALELLDKEFISSEDNTTSKYYGKWNEEDIFNLDNNSLNARKIDLGNAYSHRIFNLLYDFLMKNNISDVCWLVYGTIHRCFVNVPFDTYLPILKKFNQLGRPDASLLIFQQMKKLNRLFGLPPPNQEHYIYLLESFGEMSYETGIIQLHAMLRMDLSVDVNIKMNNALLGAYTNLQDFMKARDLFERMLAIPKNDKNAVNSQTVNTMLKAYTYGGIKHVEAFWNNLTDIDYLPDESNYKQFIISNCYHEKYDDALELIEEMKFNGLPVKADIIKELYNRTEDPQAKKKVKMWILLSEYASEWKMLEQSGQLVHQAIEDANNND